MRVFQTMMFRKQVCFVNSQFCGETGSNDRHSHTIKTHAHERSICQQKNPPHVCGFTHIVCPVRFPACSVPADPCLNRCGIRCGNGSQISPCFCFFSFLPSQILLGMMFGNIFKFHLSFWECSKIPSLTNLTRHRLLAPHVTLPLTRASAH